MPFMRTIVRLELISIALLCTFAQTPTGVIVGSVTDPSGGAVANARIELVNEQTGFKRDASSDTTGAFRVPDLPAGPYGLSVEVPGFKKYEQSGIALTVKSGSLEDILNGVDQGRVDVAIGLFKGLPDRFMTCRLLSDEHACVMQSDHPLGRSPLTLDRYLHAPHLLISMSGSTNNAVDDALAEQGLRRRIVMQMPHGLAAVVALARSDMITSVTRGVARVFAATTPAVVTDLPFVVPASTFRLVWNRRFHADPARMWLRRKLVAIAAAVETAS